MAGDWIKVEKATARKPEIFLLAAALSISPDEAFGLCVRFWCWCDDHVHDGDVPLSHSLLDDALSRPGLSLALLDVGWLQVRSGSLVIPHFARHMGQTAKTRLDAADRQRRHRKKRNVTNSCDKPVTREEKRREENLPSEDKPPLPPEIQNAWDEYTAYRREQRLKSLKPRSIAKQLESLAQWAGEFGVPAVVESIGRTIANGYTGIFAPKPSGKTAEPRTPVKQEPYNPRKHGDLETAKANNPTIR